MLNHFTYFNLLLLSGVRSSSALSVLSTHAARWDNEELAVNAKSTVIALEKRYSLWSTILEYTFTLRLNAVMAETTRVWYQLVSIDGSLQRLQRRLRFVVSH